jgi:adenylate cyclase
MKLSPKTKRSIQQIIPFGIIFMLSGWVFLLIESVASDNFNQIPETAIKMDTQIFILSSLAVGGVGMLMGFIELRYIKHLFLSKFFLLRMLNKLVVYSIFFMLTILLLFPIAASLELNVPISDPLVWEKYLDYFWSWTHLSTGVQLGMSLLLSLFYVEISGFIGQKKLIDFFSGRYHLPIEEDRIFMFLDMKSSTTIAEKLGHAQYYKLLDAYYRSFSDAIIDHEGEIYQYVGDEIVLTWKLLPNQKDNRSIDCFFAMKAALEQEREMFQERFGVVPSFKAGIHVGRVTTGQIGAIKKEIIFTGDVLNAAARIQSLCNSYGLDLILSGEMIKHLELGKDKELGFLGEVVLRGKEEKKELFTVREKKAKKNDVSFYTNEQLFI